MSAYDKGRVGRLSTDLLRCLGMPGRQVSDTMCRMDALMQPREWAAPKGWPFTRMVCLQEPLSLGMVARGRVHAILLGADGQVHFYKSSRVQDLWEAGNQPPPTLARHLRERFTRLGASLGDATGLNQFPMDAIENIMLSRLMDMSRSGTPLHLPRAIHCASQARHGKWQVWMHTMRRNCSSSGRFSIYEGLGNVLPAWIADLDLHLDLDLKKPYAAWRVLPTGWKVSGISKFLLGEVNKAIDVSSRWNECLQIFSRRLDKDLVEAAACFPTEHKWHGYNWLTGDGDTILRLRRMQAVEAQPFLVGKLVGHTADVAMDRFPSKRTLGYREALRVVDEGKPLSIALSTCFDLSAQAVRALSGMKPTETCRLDAFINMHFDTACIENRWPRGGVDERIAQWEHLVNVAQFLNTLSTGRNNMMGRTLSELLTSEPATWLRPDKVRAVNTECAWQVQDMVDGLIQSVLIPAVLDRALQSGACADWSNLEATCRRLLPLAMGERTVSALVRMSDRWHIMQSATTCLITMAYDKRTWPEAFVPRASMGLLCVPLSSAYLLAEDGLTMKHCVRSYTSSCITGDSVIVSIRTKDGIRLSTLEMYVQDGICQMVQHCGVSNDDPSPEAEAAAARLLSDIEADPALVDYEALSALRKENECSSEDDSTDAVSKISNIMGYDVMDDDARNMSLQEHAFMLDIHSEGMTYAEWVLASGIGNELDRIKVATVRPSSLPPRP